MARSRERQQRLCPPQPAACSTQTADSSSSRSHLSGFPLPAGRQLLVEVQDRLVLQQVLGQHELLVQRRLDLLVGHRRDGLCALHLHPQLRPRRLHRLRRRRRRSSSSSSSSSSSWLLLLCTAASRTGGRRRIGLCRRPAATSRRVKKDHAS